MKKTGRKEVLDLETAKKICSLIRRMPDANVEVTWANVITHVAKRTGTTYTRQMLSQKKFNDRKIITEIFNESKSIQKRMVSDGQLKYQTASRALLRTTISNLEAKVLALQEELESERARKVCELDAFLDSSRDLLAVFGMEPVGANTER